LGSLSCFSRIKDPPYFTSASGSDVGAPAPSGKASEGGKIEVKSKEGEGSEFIVYLPL
jgi:hypothetical protein